MGDTPFLDKDTHKYLLIAFIMNELCLKDVLAFCSVANMSCSDKILDLMSMLLFMSLALVAASFVIGRSESLQNARNIKYASSSNGSSIPTSSGSFTF